MLLFACASFLGESEVSLKTGIDRVVHLEDPFETKYAARLCRGAHFAVAPDDGLGSSFRRFLAQQTASGSAPELVAFKDADAVENYVRSEEYGQPSHPWLCGAVTFDSPDGSKYTIRLNGTIIGNRGAVCGGVDTRRVLTGRAIDSVATSQDWYLCSGFLSLQRLVDDFVMRRGGGWNPRLEVDVLPFPTPSFKQRKALSSLREFISLFVVAFFAYASGQATSSIVAEREAKLLEAMKLMGLQDSARYLAETCQVLPLFVWYGLQLSVGLGFGVFIRCDPMLLACFMSLVGLSFGSAALCFSALFESAKGASLATMVSMFGVSRMPLEQAFGLLLPPVALVRGLMQLIDLELAGPGLQWSNLWHGQNSSNSLGEMMTAQLLAVPCFLFLWRYLEQVVPRDYGSRAGRARTAAAVPSEVVTRRRAQGKIAEETLPVACTVELQNVRKEFLIGGRRPNRRVVAVKRLDLGLAEGEILALLGHNGAGKSTTVSMLTGVLPPTEGRVIIHGYDVAQHPEEARRFLGVCPQHDILFDFLSADDHLRLAASLRGVQGGGSAQDLLRAVGLLGHLLGAPAGQLSSGRRRALCVALAFVGDPRFILLDEPTSGMDPYVRRSMWELLKKYRPGRALCLSTHYMDEAEMLGDHVCILSRGTLQCYGSPEWLKARLGSGYALTLSATQATRTLQVAKTALDLLQRNASKDLRSQMVVTRCEGSEAVLRVPFAVGSSFPELLRVLESQKTLLGFSSLSVSATTLEELFLSLADGEEAGEPKSLSPKKTPLSGASSPEKVEMPGGLDEQAASQMAAAMADLERSKPSKAHQGAALLRKRCLTLRRNRRAMLCLCLLPMIFNILGIASIATSFELDSPPLEIFGTSQALNPELAKQQKPSVVVAFGATGGGAEALMNAGVQAALWEVQPLSVNSNSLRATSRRNLSESLIIDANVLGGKSDPNEPEMDMSKYKEMKQKGAPEFVIRKVMEKDGVPTAVSERFMSGAAPATGSSERSLTGRLKVGLQDQAMLSLDAGQREAKVQFMFGEAAMKVDVKRAEEQRQELAQCASGGPMQLQLAEEAVRRLDEDTQKNLQAMQEGGAPSFAQRAFLEKAGVAEEDVEILAFFASPEQVPSERLEDLQRCAKWQAFAEALLETRHELKAARYGGIFVERLNVKSRSPRGRLAIFQNTSVFHSAPLFLGLATKALAEDASVSAVRVPEVTNWPLPLTHRQRTLAFSSQGWSFFSMSLLGVAFLPAGLAVDAASSLCCGAIRQQAIAGMPLATYILASFAADVVLVMVPALSQLVFVYFFQMAVFVDCLGILTLLLVLYVLASTAQVYAMLSRFKSPNSAQNSTLALNMLTGFFLALTVWVLGIPFLGETANRLARAFTLLGRLSPAFNLSNAVLTIPNTSMPGFSNVNGFPISDWQVTGEPLLGLAVNLLLYSMLALRRRSVLRFGVSHGGASGGAMGHKDRGVSGSASREVAPEVQAERLAAEQALGSPPKGLVLGSCSVSYTSPGPATPVLEPLSVLAGSGILGVLGVSGSGKSSLLAALAGGLPCNGSMQGQALLDGQRLASLHQSFGAVGYCPQENELTPGLTVREQIELFGRLRGLAGDQLDAEVRWLCFTLDLEAFEESQSENLSGGNQRKLQCACALVGSPRLVCLDEPSAGLDPMARRCLGNSLRAKMKVLSAVIIATKSIDEADALCSKLMFLTKDGCLRTVGSSLEIRQRYGGGHELRATLRRPSMQEVYDQVRSDPSLLRGFIGSCCRSLGIDPRRSCWRRWRRRPLGSWQT